jgi:hypothetical protein
MTIIIDGVRIPDDAVRSVAADRPQRSTAVAWPA